MTPTFIKLHVHGDPILFNLSYVVCFEPKNDGTLITYRNGVGTFTVDESYEEVSRRLHGVSI